MKKTLPILVLLFGLLCHAQEENADYFLNQGMKQNSQNQYVEAVESLKQSVSLAAESEDKVTLIKAYAGLGEAYHKADQPKLATKNYLLSLSHAKTLKDGNAIIKASKELGELYAGEEDYGLSVQYYTYAIKEAKQLNNEVLEAEVLVELGEVYELQDKPEPALDAYSRALAIYRARGKNSEAGHTLSKMGNAYRKKTDYVQSILNYKEALGYFAGLDDRKNVAATLSDLGKVHALNDDYSESLRLYEQAYLDASSIKDNEVIISSCLGMAIAYEKLKQYPESIRYHKLYEQKKDSLVTAKHAQALQTLQSKYKKQRDENESRLLGTDGGEQEGVSSGDSISRAEYEATKRTRIIIIGVCSIIVLLVIGWFWKRKQQLKEKLREERMNHETERQERLRMVQDIHSDLDSKLSKINYLSESIVEKTHGMPTIKSSGEAMQDTTKKLEENIRDLVWLLTPRSTTLSNYITNTQEYVTDYFKDSPVEVLFSMPDKPSTNTIVKESQRELTAAIKESLEAIAEDPQASKVFFGMSFSGTRLMVSIKDNGAGTDRNEASKKTMENHIVSIGGIMKVDAEQGWGTMVKMIIPINKQIRKSMKKV
ncbi:hypothetical protein Q763_16285 [Flavobacterium beibuense F44-8]|uniref:Uncharacterized protein n=1 Tax=Flavobacterium beibuense F44-8 TaxID=1406840 RepID=A0A0A2LI29_9FLAO|nr:tetratricopeptide repeat-containing sensor histidine kinase [Flavobacterium beibuense]KGO78843.1 hypothetical protein Q763_16285 [Flavobacterium beibuense F44-8]